MATASAASLPGLSTWAVSRMMRAFGCRAADGGDDVLAAPHRFAGALHVERGVGVGSWVADLTGVFVDDLVAGLGPEQWCDDLAVGVDDPVEIRMRPRAATVGVEQADLDCLVVRPIPGGSRESIEHRRVGEVSGAPVEIVVASHRSRWEPPLGFVREAMADQGADSVPYEWMREFGFDPSRRPVDRQQRVEPGPGRDRSNWWEKTPRVRRPELRDGSVAVDTPGADADSGSSSVISAGERVSGRGRSGRGVSAQAVSSASASASVEEQYQPIEAAGVREEVEAPAGPDRCCGRSRARGCRRSGG
jgi:hypothetical protein